MFAYFARSSLAVLATFLGFTQKSRRNVPCPRHRIERRDADPGLCQLGQNGGERADLVVALEEANLLGRNFELHSPRYRSKAGGLRKQNQLPSALKTLRSPSA